MTLQPDRARLLDFCEIVQGGRLKLTGKHFVDTGYPAYGAGGINGYLPSYEFEKPAVILSAIGARCGKCFIPDGKWVSLANTQLIFPDAGRADVRFLWYQLNDESSWHRSGTGQPFIKPSDVRNRLAYLPPLPVQKRIAAILDAADALRAKRRESIEQLDSLIQATFLEMFGDPITNPKSWEIAPIRQLAELENGDRSSNYPSGSDLVDSGVFFLSTKNIVENSISLHVSQWITQAKFASLTRGKLQRYDLVITLRGTLGSCAIFDCEHDTGFINAQLMIVRSTLINHVYLHRCLASRAVQQFLEQESTGGTVKQLTSRQIGDLAIPRPPLDLQTRFASIVESIERQKARLKAHLAELDTLFASLQSRAFDGELVA